MLSTDKGKYTITESEAKPILAIPSDYRSEAEKLEIVSYSDQVKDLDLKIDRLFGHYTAFAYLNLTFFILLTVSMVLYIMIAGKMPPLLFWLVFVIRNMLLVASMFLIIKSKTERNSQSQKNIYDMLKVTLVFCVARWIFDLNTKEEYVIQWNPAINLIMNSTEFILSTLGIIFFMYQTNRLRLILETRESM